MIQIASKFSRPEHLWCCNLNIIKTKAEWHCLCNNPEIICPIKFYIFFRANKHKYFNKRMVICSCSAVVIQINNYATFNVQIIIIIGIFNCKFQQK